MFEDWKKAWREAVENFKRELNDTQAAGGNVGPHVRAMRQDIASVRGALSKLDAEIARATREAGKERDAEVIARRREGLARHVGDDETVRVAGEFATRHAERAGILERKVDVLRQERALLARDLEAMEEILVKHAPPVGAAPEPDVLEREARTNHDFGKLEREARERAAAERLEELKKKMR